MTLLQNVQKDFMSYLGGTEEFTREVCECLPWVFNGTDTLDNVACSCAVVQAILQNLEVCSGNFQFKPAHLRTALAIPSGPCARSACV